jgi:hypothetical protein
MTFITSLQIAVKIFPWAAAAILGGMWYFTRVRAKAERERADRVELTLNATRADIARKNAALVTIADNMEKMKDEKTRISKSDLDGLILHARELSDVVPEEYGTGGSGGGGNSGTGKDVISGALI